jgi:hypothetical protein
VEHWHSASTDIFCGKVGDLTGDGRESVEVSALALHLVQASIAYLNTILIWAVVRDLKWRKKLTAIDLRGLSALFWTNVNLYGRLELDMSQHLDLNLDGLAQPETGRGAELWQGGGDGAAAEERLEYLGGHDGAAGGLGGPVDLLVDRGHDQVAVGGLPGQGGGGQAR